MKSIILFMALIASSQSFGYSFDSSEGCIRQEQAKDVGIEAVLEKFSEAKNLEQIINQIEYAHESKFAIKGGRSFSGSVLVEGEQSFCNAKVEVSCFGDAYIDQSACKQLKLN
jgi:hypothetical protein